MSKEILFDFKKVHRELYIPKNAPEILNIPKMNYIAMQGIGNPNEENGAYQAALKVLYAIAYTLKMSYKSDHKIQGFFKYIVPPLEGFWWQDGIKSVDYKNKNAFNWISVIRLPDFISQRDFEWAKADVKTKKNIDCDAAKFLIYDEGICVQCMHFGGYDSEPHTVELMHRYLVDKGYILDISNTRMHHEIYLTDPRKTPVEKFKTVIRHPIKRL